VENGARIERHVPALPLSRDANRADMLRRALAVYRMAFGQARQEDLIEFLRQRISKDAIPAMASELRIDLSPPKTAMLHASRDEIERVESRSEEIANEDEWMLPEDFGDSMLSLDSAVDLLNEYAARVSVSDAGTAAEQYRNLLDALLSCGARGV